MEVLSASEDYNDDKFEDAPSDRFNKKKPDKKAKKSKEEKDRETPPGTPLDMANLFKIDLSHLSDIL